jgi:hypothetical protein
MASEVFAGRPDVFAAHSYDRGHSGARDARDNTIHVEIFLCSRKCLSYIASSVERTALMRSEGPAV